MNYSDSDLVAMANAGGRPYSHRTLSFNYSPNAMGFGWVPPGDRTSEEQDADEAILSTLDNFRLDGNDAGTSSKTCLFDLWKHVRTTDALGFTYTGNHQRSGSCIGAGGGNAVFSTMAAEVILQDDLELICVPFWLYTYGCSRNHAGMRGRGEGSTGAGFARAITTDGIVSANYSGLPRYTTNDGLEWGASVEVEWSDGQNTPIDVRAQAKTHLVKTAAVCKSADDVRDAIRNGYGVACASDWGGKMQCPVVEGVLLNSRTGTWMHQMSYQAWWDHEKLGEIFYVMNQWGLSAHGTCPSGAPQGGFWVKRPDVDYVCRNGEVFAFSALAGFPVRDFSWFI